MRKLWLIMGLAVLVRCSFAAAVCPDAIIVATTDGEKGDILKLDGTTLGALAGYRGDFWEPIASILPLPNGNFAVIPFKDDAPQDGRRASVRLVNARDFAAYGYADVVATYTHSATTAATKGGATGGTVNSHGEVFMFAPSGRFSDYEGAMTLNGLDPRLPPLRNERTFGNLSISDGEAGFATITINDGVDHTDVFVSDNGGCRNKIALTGNSDGLDGSYTVISSDFDTNTILTLAEAISGSSSNGGSIARLEFALDGYFEIFVPDGSSALPNGDWVLVMNQARPTVKGRPGVVMIRKRHDIRTNLGPGARLSGKFPTLTKSATNAEGRIAVGDAEGNVYELSVNAENELLLGASGQAADLGGPGSTVSDVLALSTGDWVFAINCPGEGPGSVWVLEKGTLGTLSRLSGLAQVNALGVQSDDGVLVGTQSGELLIYDSKLRTLKQSADGFDPITNIAVLSGDGGVPEDVAPSAEKEAMETPVPAAKNAGWVNSLKPHGKPGTEITLARDGTSDYYILCPANPTTQEEKAAMDLGFWFHEMTGAQFPLVKEGSGASGTANGAGPGRYTLLGVGKRIVIQSVPVKFVSVGRTNLLSRARLPESGLDLGDEGYAIAQQGDNLYLIGGKRRGPINAVYALLEEGLGCRWYTRRSNAIPRLTELRFRPVPRSFVPTLDIRDPYYHDAFDGTWSLRNRTSSPFAAVPEKWGGYIKSPWFTHGFGNILNQGEDFKKHPEYFSEIGGRRVSRQLCLTNPDVLRIAIAKVLAALKQNPDARLMSVSPYDGGGHCECTRCRAIDDENGSPAGSLIWFVNQVAEAVEKQHPQVMLSTLAYLDTLDALSKVRPRHNVAVQLCNDLHAWRWPLADFVSSDRPKSERYRNAVVEWSKVCNTIHVWDYFANFSHYLGPMPNMHVLEPSVKFYLEHNAKGIMFQAAYQSTGGERALMRSWVMAKLLWDPSRDVAALQQDYAYGYYQEAGPAIAAYYELMDRVGPQYQDEVVEEMGGIRYPMDAPFLTREFIDQADELSRRAEALARSDEILRRVKLQRLPLLYVKLDRGKGFTDDDYMKLLDEFEEITTREGVTHLREGPPDVKQKIEYWRSKAKE